MIRAWAKDCLGNAKASGIVTGNSRISLSVSEQKYGGPPEAYIVHTGGEPEIRILFKEKPLEESEVLDAPDLVG